jgi:hypothetical protein
MKKILVNKPENVWQLKILFPSIKLAVDGIPAHGKIVYVNFPVGLSEKTEFVFEQSVAGYNLDTHLGLLGFLRECNYMSPAKLDRFSVAGRAGQVDSKGREVLSVGKFYRNQDVLAMYFFCSTLRISNRIFLDDEIDEGYVLDVLEASLYDRIREADRIGHGKLMGKVLRLFDSFYSKDIQFRARRQGRVGGFERMQQVANTFNRKAFKDFRLSGDEMEDVYVFLSLFGEV